MNRCGSVRCGSNRIKSRNSSITNRIQRINDKYWDELTTFPCRNGQCWAMTMSAAAKKESRRYRDEKDRRIIGIAKHMAQFVASLAHFVVRRPKIKKKKKKKKGKKVPSQHLHFHAHRFSSISIRWQLQHLLIYITHSALAAFTGFRATIRRHHHLWNCSEIALKLFRKLFKSCSETALKLP